MTQTFLAGSAVAQMLQGKDHPSPFVDSFLPSARTAKV
jgi:hypothetical protein